MVHKKCLKQYVIVGKPICFAYDIMNFPTRSTRNSKGDENEIKEDLLLSSGTYVIFDHGG